MCSTLISVYVVPEGDDGSGSGVMVELTEGVGVTEMVISIDVPGV